LTVHFGDGTSIDSGGSLGKVLQVQSTIKRDTASYSLGSSGTSMSYSSQILSVNITPSNSNNKILVTGHLCVCSDPIDRLHIRLLKNGGELGNASATANGSHRRRGHASSNARNDRSQNTPIVFLDTAGSTSQISYGYNVAQGSGGTGTVFINRQATGFSDEANRFLGTSVITVMEIAA